MQRALPILLTLVACRAPLPPPVQPLTATPDAPFRASAPAAADASLPELTVLTSSRADGLVVWAVERPQARVTAFGFASPWASLAYPQPNGAALLAAHAQSARLKGPAALAKVQGKVDLGGLGLIAEVPSEDALNFAPQFAAVMSSPPDDEAIRHAQNTLQGQLRKISAGDQTIKDRLTHAHLFGERHPLAQKARDLAQQANRLARSDLADFWRERAMAGPRRFVVVGPGAEALAKRILAELPAPAGGAKAPAPWPRPQPKDQLRIRVVPKNTSPWIELSFPIEAPGVGAPEASMASLVLGGALSGRLGSALRLDSGHSYALFARYRDVSDFGLLTMSGNVSEEDVPLFISTAQGVLSSLRDTPVTPAELTQALGTWRGQLRRGLATSRGATLQLLGYPTWDGAPPDFAAVYRQLQAVDAARLQTWSQAHIRPQVGSAVVFARAQELTTLYPLGDAAQVTLDPF
ncbi:MAG: insulinase family protein [Deltaproteobacteria bacterium]|nr:insulinase family protein [Deltaproteobacteria bacterium]